MLGARAHGALEAGAALEAGDELDGDDAADAPRAACRWASHTTHAVPSAAAVASTGVQCDSAKATAPMAMSTSEARSAGWMLSRS
jgi:hypothetical protein